MVEISEDELTLIENALVSVQDAISEDTTDMGMALKQQVTEAIQVCSGKLDAQQGVADTATGGPGAP